MAADPHVGTQESLAFSSDPQEYAVSPVPSLYEFERLWTAWDLVTRQMIPHEELRSKPIKLRNACIFYLGHIPAFLDIHLTKATGEQATEPAFYHDIFERGIDPDVDNPENCHAHSPIPDEWPPLTEILSYQEAVRRRTRALYKNERSKTDRRLGRSLWMDFEHEGSLLPKSQAQTDQIQPCILRPCSTCFCRATRQYHQRRMLQTFRSLPDRLNEQKCLINGLESRRKL